MRLSKTVSASAILVLATVIVSKAAETRNIVLQGGAAASTSVAVLIHNAIPVTIRFKVTRDGSNNNYAQREARFRLISPNGSFEGVIRSIGGNLETFELNLPAAGNSGNEVRLWKAEIVNTELPMNPEVSQPIRGTVEFFTTGSQTKTLSSPPQFGLLQGGTATKTIYMPFTGNLTIQARWDADELVPVDYAMTFELYKGSTRLAFDSGHSVGSWNPLITEDKKMKITYRVKARDFQITGDWKVKVYGSGGGKVKNIDLKMTISDGLYE